MENNTHTTQPVSREGEQFIQKHIEWIIDETANHFVGNHYYEDFANEKERFYKNILTTLEQPLPTKEHSDLSGREGEVTAMMEFLSWLDMELECPNVPPVDNTLKGVKAKATELLAKEREQIVDAYQQGSEGKYSGEIYFKDTYKQ